MHPRSTLYRRSFLSFLAVVLVMGTAFCSPTVRADPESISTFEGGLSEVELTFRQNMQNTSAAISIPRGATVLTAEMDLEGLRMPGDYQSSYDYSNYNPTTTPHRAWCGWVQSNYPPSHPFWDPDSPRGSALTVSEYGDVGASDDDRLQTKTGVRTTDRYPFHLFRFELPEGSVTELGLGWEGHGYCLANSTGTRGAEVFLWCNASKAWDKVASYSRSEALQDRTLEKTIGTNPGRYIDGKEQVFVLVYGKRSENVAGPNPWTAEGEINTDHVRLNATFEAGYEYVANVSLGVVAAEEVWDHVGVLEGRVHIGDAQDLGGAIQKAVDAAEISPGNLTVGLYVNVSGKTAGVVRLSNLTISYEPLLNGPPEWGSFPSLTMEEDTDAIKLLDLDTVASDDHSQGGLVYEVVWASTTAIEARVEEGNFLSLHARQAHWHGTASFRVNATDAWGLASSSPVFDVEVTEVNDPPELHLIEPMTTSEDEPFHHQIEAADIDGDAISFSDDTEIFDIDPATGAIDFTPDNDDVGTHEIAITATDARGLSARGLMFLTVTNSNDDPVILDPGTLTGRQGVPFDHTFVADDPDMLYGDSLTWLVQGDDFYRSNLLIEPATGLLRWLNILPTDVGDHHFQVQVVDTGGGEDQIDVHLVIENVNDPPTFSAILDQTVKEGEELRLTIEFADLDLGRDPGECLTWTVEPSWFSVGPSGTMVFVPDREHVGRTTVLVTLADRAGESHYQTFLLTVIAVNRPPLIDQVPDQTILEDELWSFDLLVRDIDPGDTVHVSARSAPFSVPERGGTVRWTPGQEHVGEHVIVIEASDSEGAVTTMTFNVTVVLRDDPPTVTIVQPADGSVISSEDAVDLEATAEDEEGAHLTILWKWRRQGTQGDWTEIGSGDALSWTTLPSGKLEVLAEVSDGVNVVTDVVLVEVEGPPEGVSVSGGLLAALVAVVAIVILVAYLLVRRRRGAVTDHRDGP